MHPEKREKFILEGRDLNLNLLIDEIDNFISYDGSLSYPPCNEGVKYFLIREISKVSKKLLLFNL